MIHENAPSLSQFSSEQFRSLFLFSLLFFFFFINNACADFRFEARYTYIHQTTHPRTYTHVSLYSLLSSPWPVVFPDTEPQALRFPGVTQFRLSPHRRSVLAWRTSTTYVAPYNTPTQIRRPFRMSFNPYPRYYSFLPLSPYRFPFPFWNFLSVVLSQFRNSLHSESRIFLMEHILATLLVRLDVGKFSVTELI